MGCKSTKDPENFTMKSAEVGINPEDPSSHQAKVVDTRIIIA